ncbi:MAG: zinc-binding dehydrogenase [Bacteroidota bacterium]
MNNLQAILSDFGGPDKISVRESELPIPRDGEVRVRVEASGICSTDTLIRKGIYPLLREKPPLCLGYDLIGRVEAIGQSVPRHWLGKRVGALVQIGGNARFACVPASLLLRIPEEADAADAAALLLNYMSAYEMLRQSNAIEKGGSILVQGGSGAVGTAFCQLGRHFGLSVVASASATKQAYVRSQGATAIDYRSARLEQILQDAAPTSYVAAFDAIGPGSFDRSFRLLQHEGRLITFGTYLKGKSIPRKSMLHFLSFGFTFGKMLLGNRWRNLNTKGKSASFFGIMDIFHKSREQFQNHLDFLFQLLAAGNIKPHIHRRLPLSDVADGHRMLDQGEVCGQLIILPQQLSNENG